MRIAYRGLAYAIAAGVFLQAAAIALAWFTFINDVEGGLVADANYEGNAFHALHGIVGMNIMPLLALVFFIVSFFAKFAGGVKFAGITLLLVVLQVVLAIVAFSAPVVGALHGLNAFAILAVAGFAAHRVPAGAPAAKRSGKPFAGATS